ncbi:MAG: hypothetical protein H6821_06410 [Planctomycetaceae bacterium]|nr:hypothetical protein [Planctomycetales bacterium]MCB9873796.1 hypothetical protein [Planctomycetaceae bacterium]MCB9939713.1 hypothetical protein [Planctomycetaceae bacterium]
MDDIFSEPHLERRFTAVRSLQEEGDDREFWRSQTPEQRFLAAEQMRQIAYGYDPTSDRLQRVLRVVELGEI